MSTSREYPDGFLLLLASQSPRRQELLTALGVPHLVVSSSADEREHGGPPHALAERNARAKVEGAEVPDDVGPGAFVLGTDTIVVVDGTILGKPSDAPHARQMLDLLAGRAHEVVSGMALRRLGADRKSDELAVGHALTTVRFDRLTHREREAYVASGEWEGKAGGYAIQGLAALFVDRIEGDHSNVVGLPLALLRRLFRRLGFDLLGAEWVEPFEAMGASGSSAGIIPGSGTSRQEG